MENIRPIKTEEDYQWALSEVTKYFDNQPEIGSKDADRFDILSILLEAYESEHFPIYAPTPIEALATYMQMHGLNHSALANLLGSRSRASEILNYRRALTMAMAYKINKEWHIPAEILLQPYHLADYHSAA